MNRAAHPERPVELSVVFAARGGFENNRKTIECLLGQTVARHIELIVISDVAELLSDIDAFVAAQGNLARSEFMFHAGDDVDSDRVRAATKATAAVVAFAEDHAFPEEIWAEELIAAFASSENILAAAPLLVNPNPESAVSRAQFLLTHGWHERRPESERFEDSEQLSWHSTAYRKDAFAAETGDGHVELFQAEAFLREHIRRANPAARFVRCTRARINHVNMSRFWPAVLLAFHGGRIFAAVRARERGWRVGTRIVRGALFPAVAILKLWRTASQLWDNSSWVQTVLNYALAATLAFVHALGEAVGSWFGIGGSVRAYSRGEFNRAPFLRPAERHLLCASGVSVRDTSPDACCPGGRNRGRGS